MLEVMQQGIYDECKKNVSKRRAVLIDADNAQPSKKLGDRISI
jgi:hypothetical protein